MVKISPRSVFRVALAVYLGILATVVAATTGLWLMLEVTGTIENIESFMGELLGYEDFQFLFGRIFLVLTLLGLVWVVISATVTSLLAALYNRVARLTGGIRVTVDDDA
ncbi:MAG: DUF3566 domain-containing protein [Actinobacteria bacterium]|nr:DUF3566 domain-containing protein [Actinomycetota bacterium]